MPTRRMVLLSAGAAAVVGGVGVAGYAHAPGGEPARRPWSRAGDSLGDARLDALAFAILAPNPHNRQPWTFELVGDDAIDVRCDLERRLPQTDPFDRQITIGFGCMLELLRQAAAEKGWEAVIEPFPDGAPPATRDGRLNGGRIAHVTFERSAAAAPDPLFESVLERRSTKEPYDLGTPPPSGALDGVLAAADGFGLHAGATVEADRVTRLIDVALRAWTIEFETERTWRESVELMRIGNREIAANPDGIELGGVADGLLRMAGVMTPEAFMTPNSAANRASVGIYDDMIRSTPGFVWLVSKDNARQSALDAGAAWVRMNLAAHRAGLAVHPVSQALQEFPEMTAAYAAAHDELGAPAGGAVQMLGRIGYHAGRAPAPTPRWPLEAKLVEGGV